MIIKQPAHYPRFMEESIREELKLNPAVILAGPRQSGKTTLVRKFENEEFKYFTLNHRPTLTAVKHDLEGFLRSHEKIIVDECQRHDLSQGLISAIDERGSNGEFILTGFFTCGGFDSLAGRVARLELLPLAKAELCQCKQPGFLSRAFDGKAPIAAEGSFVESEFIVFLLNGGYPRLIQRDNKRARAAWLRHYLHSIKEFDIPALKKFRGEIPTKKLLEILLKHVGSKINIAKSSEDLGITRQKVEELLDVFEKLYLIKRLPPYKKTSCPHTKLNFIDTGIYAQIAKLTQAKIARNRTLLGPLLETFVYGELAKHCAWANNGHELAYYQKDKPRKTEVDIVVEDSAGRLVGIEVKAAVGANLDDLKGLEAMKEEYKDDMVLGLIINLGSPIVMDSGKNFHVVNVSSLWADYEQASDAPLFDN